MISELEKLQITTEFSHKNLVKQCCGEIATSAIGLGLITTHISHLLTAGTLLASPMTLPVYALLTTAYIWTAYRGKRDLDIALKHDYNAVSYKFYDTEDGIMHRMTPLALS